MRDLAVGDSVDRYEITDILARSGMATIFKAIDGDSGGPVVLKVPHIQYESDVVYYERFQREEAIGRRLDHANIVRFLTPHEKSRMYLVMEYVAGESLRASLRSNGLLVTARALEIARQLCSAVSYLHRNGVVHRDIKPENVLLVPPDGTVKLLDFGIAFVDSARRLTWTGLSGALGTPDYMAPEQIRGRRGDARTDVYAIGTILYEMLTGHLPYEAPNTASLLRAKTSGPPTPPGEHTRDMHPSLEAILLKALAYDPRHRYATAEEMLVDLRDPYTFASRSKAAQAARKPARAGRRVSLALLIGMAATALAWRARVKSSRPERSSLVELRDSRGGARP